MEPGLGLSLALAVGDGVGVAGGEVGGEVGGVAVGVSAGVLVDVVAEGFNGAGFPSVGMGDGLGFAPGSGGTLSTPRALGARPAYCAATVSTVRTYA